MRRFISIFFALVLVLSFSLIPAVPTNADGNTYYVATTGSDDTGNGSEGNPWLTITYAISQASAGDTIIVAAGTYTENVEVNKQLTLTGDLGQPGNVVVDAGGSGSAITLIVDGCVLQGFKVQNGEHGIYLDGSSNNTLTGNHITGNNIGVKIQQPVDASTISINFNNIYGNTNYGVDNTGATSDVYAENNWWGANDGPSTSPGSGDKVSGNVDYEPWLVLNISAHSISIIADGSSTSTITADMTKNSNGEDTSTLGHIPDGTQIVFTTNKGSIGSLEVTKTTTDGKATATLTSSTTVETATVKASVPPHTPSATATTAVFFTKSGVTVEDSKTETTATGDQTVDAKDEADTEVDKSGTGTPTITVAKYSSNPGTGFSGDTGKYIDVHTDNITDVTEIVIKVYYTNAEIAGLVESSLKLYWWDDTSWVTCSDSGVNTTDTSTIRSRRRLGTATSGCFSGWLHRPFSLP